MHDKRFVKVLDSFIAVIILKTFKFKSSVSFETQTLLDKSLGLLQLLALLFRLITKRIVLFLLYLYGYKLITVG